MVDLHLVTEDGSKTVVVPAYGEYARHDEDLAAEEDVSQQSPGFSCSADFVP